MERLKNMELKKTFLVLSASCVLVALLMLGLVFMICNSISSNFPSGGIEILADGSIVKMETPTETQQNILSMLGIIQIVSCIVLPMGGLALSGILYYAVTNETVGIPSEAVKTLAENDAVESVSTTRLSVFMPGAGDILPFETDLSVQSHETLQLVNVDEAQLQIYAPNLSAQDKQALKDGTGCLVKNPIAFSYGDTTVQQTDLTVGDTIQLGDRTLPVLGLIDTAITINNDGFTNGVQLIVNDEIYCSLLGNDSYSEVYPTLQDNADTDTFESWLDSWCSNYPGTHWLSYLQSSNEMIESFEQIKMLCWVLIIFIGIIGILNIINTVYSNIHTRVGEIGMQRAIGMSAASLYKTFLWEGAYYGIIASVIGAVFGYVCCIFVGAAQTDALQLVAVPVMAIVEAAIISIVACLLATAIPLRSIARMSIVDSIETVE